MSGKTSGLVVASRKYARFLLKSYLKWNAYEDLTDTRCFVRLEKPTLVGEQAFWPQDFMGLLRDDLLRELAGTYGCESGEWEPDACVQATGNQLSLSIWFTRRGAPPASTKSPAPVVVLPPLPLASLPNEGGGGGCEEA